MASEFIQYLEENPKLFAIAKSDMCLNILRILKKTGLPFQEIKRQDFFSAFEDDDLDLLLEVLINLKLIEKNKVGNRYIYFTNKNTDKFLTMYDKHKKNFDI